MINLKFNKSFDEALQQAYSFHTEFLTDKADFTAFSTKFADPFADDILTDIQAADAMPTHENDMAQQGLLTQNVEEKMDECRQGFQKLMFFVKNTWPDNEAIARIFGNAEYLKARNVQLKMINLMQNTYNIANSITYKADLIAAGFVQLDIDFLGSLADELTSENNAQEDFKRNTFERTETKNIAFNKVWDSMVLISEASKIFFRDSPAKVEFYLLYPETPVPNPPDVPVLSYASTGFYWDEVPTATSYQLEYRAAGGGDWIGLFSGPFPANPIPFNPGPGQWNARLRARNLGGYGAWSDEVTVNIGLEPPVIWELVYNSGTNQVTLQWHNSIGASTNDIYQSVVPIGNPAGAFTLIESISAQVYQHDVTTHDVSEYYYIIARNATESSDPTATVSVDVPS